MKEAPPFNYFSVPPPMFRVDVRNRLRFEPREVRVVRVRQIQDPS